MRQAGRTSAACPTLASTVGGTPHSGIRETAALARAVPDVLNLGIGDANFVTPAHIIEAAARAAREGFTKYAPSDGFATLRGLLAAKVADRSRRDVIVSPEAASAR